MFHRLMISLAMLTSRNVQLIWAESAYFGTGFTEQSSSHRGLVSGAEIQHFRWSIVHAWG